MSRHPRKMRPSQPVLFGFATHPDRMDVPLRRRCVLGLLSMHAALSSACAGDGEGAAAEVPSPAPGTPPIPGDPESPLAPDAIANLPPGQWLQLPNTRIRRVLPPVPQQGSTGPVSIVVAWSGGTVDTKRSRLIVWGGGHNDYWGNEVYAIDLPAMTVSRIVDASPVTSQSNDQSALPDGTPTSRHTYDGLTYIPGLDRFFSVGGALSPVGKFERATWLYDFAAARWELAVANSPIVTPYGTVAEFDDASGLVYVHDNQGLYSYNPQTRTYSSRIGQGAAIDYRLTGAIDTKRRKLVLLGDGVQLVDLSTGVLTRLNTDSAPSFVTSRQAPGAAYDPVADRIVAWHGGSEVHTLDLDARTWTQVATGSGPTSAAPTQGTFGRWGYVPAYRVFVMVNSIDENAWVFRFTR